MKIHLWSVDTVAVIYQNILSVKRISYILNSYLIIHLRKRVSASIGIIQRRVSCNVKRNYINYKYSFKLFKYERSLSGCGGTLSSTRGDIISPNYPQAYSRNAECIWRIAVAAGNTVQLVIIDLDLENHAKCRYDYVEISEGTSRTRNVERYCHTHPSIINTKSNVVTIRFRSDFTISGLGFHIKYQTGMAYFHFR